MERVLAAVRGGLASLERSRARINDLNVYPVPDGDTGSNLCDTVSAIVEGLEDAPGVEARGLARTATRAALMGARGNSGVILSQIVRGFAESLEGARALTPDRLADALRAASDCAYGAVRQPVEGTMLTAVREMAAAAEASASGELDDLLDRAVAAGDAAVERTPELLDVLRRAGVVDAGAAGLAAFVRGCVEGLRGERPAGVAAALERPLSVDAIHQEPSRYRYCTTFVVEGQGVDAAALEAGLEPVGDSLLVVGERPTVRVHVHTDDPGAALSLGVGMGTID
ncbi:MAG: DAK2 domain-containing protein, partial [Gaiellales bacterium]